MLDLDLHVDYLDLSTDEHVQTSFDTLFTWFDSRSTMFRSYNEEFDLKMWLL